MPSPATNERTGVAGFVRSHPTDSAEVVSDTYTYKAFGDTAASTGTTENPFQWVGEVGYYADADLDLHHVRRRDYDPATGRFASRDPLWFEAGDSNLYRYVGNDAPDLVDPSGRGMGHHYFPKELLTGDNALKGFSQEVIDFAWGHTSGDFKLAGSHKFNEYHRRYNDYIRRLFKDVDASTVTVESPS